MKIIVKREKYWFDKIKLKVACLANKKLKEIFPENYRDNSAIKIFISTSSDPMEIIATANSDLNTEGKIGKIELNLTASKKGYSIAPIITIWASPFKESIDVNLK